MKNLLITMLLLATSFAAKADDVTSESLRVWVEIPDEIVADGQTVNYIRFYEHDDQAEYCGFNFELMLPENMFTIHQVKEGRNMVNDCKLSARADVSHSVSCNIADGYNFRCIAFSISNTDFYKDDEDGNPLDLLCTVGFIADPNTTTGSYQMRLEGVTFSTKAGEGHYPTDMPQYYTLNVKGKPSGIDEVTGDGEDTGREYYDLSGRKIDPANTAGQIVVSKGRKVLIK